MWKATRAGVIAVQDSATGGFEALTHGRDDALAKAYYASEVFRADPRAAIHMAVRPGDIYHDRALYDVKAMLRDPRVRDSIEMIGVAHQMGLMTRLPNGAAGWFTLLSTEAEGMPPEDAVRAFRRLAPHIERGASTQAALLEALAARVDGMMLLDAAGCPTFMNDGARAILASEDGLACHSGSLGTARGAETRRLHGAIRAALAARLLQCAMGLPRWYPCRRRQGAALLVPMLASESP